MIKEVEELTDIIKLKIINEDKYYYKVLDIRTFKEIKFDNLNKDKKIIEVEVSNANNIEIITDKDTYYYYNLKNNRRLKKLNYI